MSYQENKITFRDAKRYILFSQFIVIVDLIQELHVPSLRGSKRLDYAKTKST